MVKLIVKCGNDKPDEVYMDGNEPVSEGLKRIYKEPLQSSLVENIILRQKTPESFPQSPDCEAFLGDVGIPARYLAQANFELILQENSPNKDKKFDDICNNGGNTAFDHNKYTKFAIMANGNTGSETSSMSKFNRTVQCYENAYVMSEISSLHTSVCAITTPNLPKNICMKGSGFFIAPGLIITNYHVILEFIELQNDLTQNVKPLEIQEDLDLSCLSFQVVACFHPFYYLEQTDPQKEAERLKMCFRLRKIRPFEKTYLDYVIVEIEKIQTDSNFEPVAPIFDDMKVSMVLQQVHIMGWKPDVRQKVIDLCCTLLMPSNIKIYSTYPGVCGRAFTALREFL